MTYLSIVIPVRNEEKYIGETLKSLTDQDYPRNRFEIIVVDGRSTDATFTAVEKFMIEHSNINIRLLDNPKRLPSSGRNVGIRDAKGYLIGIIDGHVYIPNKNLFSNMERFKEETGALCLARPAPLDLPNLPRGKPFWIAVARKSWLGHSLKSYIYSDFEGFVDPASSGFAYDRCVFERVGHFDENFDAAEDVEFHFRLKKAGIMAYTSPHLLIYYYPRESFRALFRQQVRYGEGRAKFVRKHPQAFTWETLVPAAISLFFFSIPFAFLFLRYSSPISITYFAITLLYSSVLLATGFRESIGSKRYFPGVLVAFAIWATHMGLGWGFLKKIFFLDKS